MDANQFKEQFLPYHAKLYRVAFRLMGNTPDAEDMVQETFLKAIQQIDSYRGEGSMKAWLLVIAKNIFYSKMRSIKRTHMCLS